MNRWRMLARIISKAFWFNPGRLSLSLAALTVGATLSSAFLSLYFVLPTKIAGEFRTLGPNLAIAPRQNEQTISEDVYRRLPADVAGAPWLYAVGTVAGENVVLAGTEMSLLPSLYPGWTMASGTADRDLASIFAESRAQEFLLAGQKAVEHLGWSPGQQVEVAYGESKLRLPLRAVISSGGSEDSQVILPLAKLQALTGLTGQISVIQTRVPGSATSIESRRNEIAALLPEADVRPLRQVVESETQVVMKVRALMYGLTAVVLGIVVLSVMTTFSGLVLDRQKEIGIMKTMGASDAVVSFLFITETAVCALIAAVLGHSLGFGLAEWAAHGMFHSSLPWRWDVLGSVIGVTEIVALISTTIPIRLVRNLEPAAILKGN